MRKQSVSSSDRSKVRIFFVDADLAPGDMRELTHALTSAVRPTHVWTRDGSALRLSPPTAEPDIAGSAEAKVEQMNLETAEGPAADTQVARESPSRPRVYRKPQPVELDMAAGGKPFREFASEKGPTAHRGKYLVAAAWLHDFAKLQTITADHVFTCYKTAGWNFDVADPTVTFRQLKGEGLGGLKRGRFSINHLGLSEVVDMKTSA